MYLLDTNVLSELMEPEPNTSVLNWTDQQTEQHLYYPTITKAEILWSIALLPTGKRKDALRLAAQDIFSFFQDRCLSYSCEAAERYVEIAENSRRAGRPMSREDMMIAAIAYDQGMTLVTRNISDFDFLPMLTLHNPWGNYFLLASCTPEKLSDGQ